jgi:hypothetical protein
VGKLGSIFMEIDILMTRKISRGIIKIRYEGLINNKYQNSLKQNSFQ